MVPIADDQFELVVFALSSERFGIHAAGVVELTRSVAIVRLPHAPSIVEGMIDFHGSLVPVLDIRARFGLPAKPASLSDHLIVASNGSRLVALRVDRVLELARVAVSDIESVAGMIPDSHLLAGVARLPAGLTLIHNLQGFLSQAEAEALTALDHDGEAA